MILRKGQPLVNTSLSVPFSFNGQKYCGHAGDHLASALLAQGVKVVGRSPKYHRPRGFFSIEASEPNALFTVNGRPNIPACDIEIYEGLEVQSQGRLGFDFGAWRDFGARFMPPHAAHKTFKWPRSFWRSVYEPMLRRGASMARLSGHEEDGLFDIGHLHFDVLVVGSGLAGLKFAVEAANAGKEVLLVESDYEFGGRLIKDRGEIEGQGYRAWHDAEIAKAEAIGNLRLMKRARALGMDVEGRAQVFERHQKNDGGVFWRIHAEEIVLATGVRERPLVFPNNDRPGVMLASSMRTLVNRFGVLPGEKIAIFGQADSGLIEDLKAVGAEIVAEIDPMSGAAVTNTYGRMGLTHIRIKEGGKTRKIECDALAISAGFEPNIDLALQAGADLPPHIALIGAANGHNTDDAILADVEVQLAKLMGQKAKRKKAVKEEALSAPMPEGNGKGKQFVDLTRDVTTDDIRIAKDENLNAASAPHADVGAVPIAAYAAGARGQDYCPVRRGPSETFLNAQNAVWSEVALWRVPSHYTARKETVPRQSIDRELGYAHESLGVAERSHLMKLMIEGRDAASFLDHLCVRKISTLAEGHVRASLILRESGFALGEVIVARLSEAKFLLTASAERDEALFREIENLRAQQSGQTAIFDVTDQFALIKLAGPKAQDALENLGPGSAMKRFTVRELGMGGTNAIILAAGVTGSESYDLLVPRRYGEAALREVLKFAQANGGGLIGEGCIDVLRQEKGIIGEPELRGERSARDLGFGALMEREEDFHGKSAASQFDFADREELVGLKPIGAVQRLLAGSIVVGVGEVSEPNAIQGHVTSVSYSPHLGHMIGLAYVKNGHARLGEKIRALDLVRDFDTLSEIVDPKVYCARKRAK